MDSKRSYVIQSRTDSELDRNDFMVTHMDQNMAFQWATKNSTEFEKVRVLEQFRAVYKQYRKQWRGAVESAQSASCAQSPTSNSKLQLLCLNIEIAAICDLACPFCYRQSIATPDKIIDDELYYQLVDQAVEMNVPSIKYNWRGEALLHPRLPKFIAYAKQSGIIDTIINTNAVTLDEKKSEAIIDSGLDHLIYSFDGGSAETYNKLRPGRFHDNRFELVYENIKNFKKIRDRNGAKFPRTKIQMILTAETFKEKEKFFELFDEYVDDVSVKAYTERGGSLDDLGPYNRNSLISYLSENELPQDTPFWKDIHGDIFVSTGRLPCEQPFQRLMATYDGEVSMCCYDWDLAHPVGFVSDRSFDDRDRDYRTVFERAKIGSKGFESMAAVTMPKRYYQPSQKIQSLDEIWNGKEIDYIRRQHLLGNSDKLKVCKDCVFKEQYHWKNISKTT